MDKIDIENQLEQEQECIVNRLQKQLDRLLVEKRALEQRLSHTSQDISQTLVGHAAATAAPSTAGQFKDQTALVAEMAAQIKFLQARETELTRENQSLRNENFGLRARNQWEKDKMDSVLREKLELECSIEMDDERVYNESVTTNSRRQSSSGSVPLEELISGGSLKDLHAVIPSPRSAKSIRSVKSPVSSSPVRSPARSASASLDTNKRPMFN